MNVLRRLLERIDGNISHTLDRHLEIAIPQQRSSSPDQLASHCDVESIGAYPHCRCCSLYQPEPCSLIHRTPCDRTECGMTWAGETA